MSALIELLNGIRRSSSVEWLTPTQRECFDRVLHRARLRDPVVLMGPAGSGKTFIAWLVRRELNLGWTAEPRDIPSCASRPNSVVIDNADTAGSGARHLLARASARGWTTTVLVARFLDTQGVPSVHLRAPTGEEVAACLRRLPLPTPGLTTHGNLWQVVQHHTAESMLGGTDDSSTRA